MTTDPTDPTGYSLIVRLSFLIKDIARKGFFHLLSANFAINLLAFGSQVLVVKILTPAEMANIKTMQSFVGIAVIVGGCGFYAAVLKICSENRSDGERAGVLRASFQQTLIPIFLILAAIIVIAQLGWFSPEKQVNDWIKIFMLSVPATVFTTLIMMYLQAQKRIQLMAKLQTLIRLVAAGAIVVFTYLYGFSGFVIATVVAAFASLTGLLVLIRGDMRIAERASSLLKRAWHFARWSFGANLLTTLNGYVDIILLNYLISDRAAFGYYSIATIFVLGLNQITGTIQNIATPYFSEKADDESEFRRVLRKYQRLIVIVSAGATITAFLVVPIFITGFYGDEYSDAGLYFRLLSLKYFVWSTYALLNVALLGLGEVRLRFYSTVTGLLSSALLVFLLIRLYGLAGAAIAQVIAAAIVAGHTFWLMRQAMMRKFSSGST